MTTLADMTLRVAKICGEVLEGIATGGSGTTLIDTTITGSLYPDSYWDGGTIWFVTGVTGAYQGLSAVISHWNAGASTWTYPLPSGTFTLVPAAGDYYAVAQNQFTRHALVNAVNMALYEIGKMLLSVDATVTGTGDTDTITLPSGVSDVRRIIIEDDRSYYWNEANGVIYFDTDMGPAVGDTLRLFYMGNHAAVDADTDAISGVDEERLAWAAAVYALRDAMKPSGADRAAMNTRYQEAVARAQELRMTRPNRAMARDPHLSGW